MRPLVALALIACLTGCGAEKKPAKAKTPPGYTQDGYCIPDGINAKTGKPDFLICKTDDGQTTTYKRQ